MPTDYPIMMACEIARFTFVRDYVVKQLGAFEFVDPKKVLEESGYYKGTKPI